jgi:hypothetical protein
MVAAADYIIARSISAPTFSPADGTYPAPQSVSIVSATSGSRIHYTIDGSIPSASYGLEYAGAPVSVSGTTTLRAVTFVGSVESSVTSAAFTISGTVATPTFSPGGGSYASAQNVSISTATAGATIVYTTDGTTPTYGTVYSSPPSVFGQLPSRLSLMLAAVTPPFYNRIETVEVPRHGQHEVPDDLGERG